MASLALKPIGYLALTRRSTLRVVAEPENNDQRSAGVGDNSANSLSGGASSGSEDDPEPYPKPRHRIPSVDSVPNGSTIQGFPRGIVDALNSRAGGIFYSKLSNTTQYWYLDGTCTGKRDFYYSHNEPKEERIFYTLISRQWISTREVAEFGADFELDSGLLQSKRTLNL
jgi:hypothetical protein